jgi:hypothetical protein
LAADGGYHDGEDLSHNEISRSMESGFRNTDDSSWGSSRNLIDFEWNPAVKEEIGFDVLVIGKAETGPYGTVFLFGKNLEWRNV